MYQAFGEKNRIANNISSMYSNKDELVKGEETEELTKASEEDEEETTSDSEEESVENDEVEKGGPGSGKYAHIKLHSDNNIAIHESAEHIAAHAGISTDEYKKLHPGTKKELLTNLKNSMHHEKMQGNKKVKKSEEEDTDIEKAEAAAGKLEGELGENLEEKDIKKGEDITKLAEPIKSEENPVYSMSTGELHNKRKGFIQSLYR